MRSMSRTLRTLEKEGYVHRISYIEPDRFFGQRTFVSGLTDKALKILDDNDIYPAEYAKTFDEHSERTLDHELEISFFHIALKKFCVKHGLELYWQQRDLKKKTVAPDAYFAILDPKKPEGKNTLHYFLETERAKIGNMKNGEPSILRKLGKYYDYYNTDACEKEWASFRQFRVIVVQRNEIRMKNLLQALGEKYKNRMFWLTTEPAYKEDIGGEIFATPKDHEQRSYSFLNI
jgi:hypothetical protein